MPQAKNVAFLVYVDAASGKATSAYSVPIDSVILDRENAPQSLTGCALAPVTEGVDAVLQAIQGETTK